MFLLGCPIFIMNPKNELALQVLTLAVLASKGLKIARLSGNRNFDEKVVKAKMKSMKANGMLVPAIIVYATKVIEAGLEIVDFETGEKFVSSIDKEGLLSKSRLYVHLSKDTETAVKVGSRHGKPVVYRVAAGKMADEGYEFFLSVNGVWLTKAVPAEYLSKIL